MKLANVLICDLCKHPEFAVGTLDVCRKHSKKGRRKGKKTKAVDKPRGLRKKEFTTEAINDFLKAHPKFQIHELAKALGTTSNTVRDRIVKPLLKDKKLIKSGYGRGCFLNRVP